MHTCAHMHHSWWFTMIRISNTLTRMRVIPRFYFVHSTYRYACVLYYRCAHRCHRGIQYILRPCMQVYIRVTINWCVYQLRFLGGQFTYFERMRTHAPVGKRTHMRILFSFGMNRFPLFFLNTHACAFGACAIY